MREGEAISPSRDEERRRKRERGEEEREGECLRGATIWT